MHVAVPIIKKKHHIIFGGGGGRVGICQLNLSHDEQTDRQTGASFRISPSHTLDPCEPSSLLSQATADSGNNAN